MKENKHTITTIQSGTMLERSKHRVAQPRSGLLLDLGPATIQTKGGVGNKVENVDCIIRGHIICQ